MAAEKPLQSLVKEHCNNRYGHERHLQPVIIDPESISLTNH